MWTRSQWPYMTCSLWLKKISTKSVATCMGAYLRLEPPPSVWPHLFRVAGHEKRRGEQLMWSLIFRLYIGSFRCAQLPGPVHTAWLGRVFFWCILPRFVLYVFICAFWFVCMSPFFYASLSSWVISLTVFGISITNLNEPPRDLAASTIASVSIPFGQL